MLETFFDLTFIAFVTLIHDGLLQRTPPFSICLTVKLKWFFSEPCPPVDSRKEEMNTPPCRMLGILEDVCQIHGLFTLVPYHRPHLWSIKEPGIQTHIRWLFHDISLPSSWSASFLNKVIFLASTPRLWNSLACCVASRASLDSVTKCLPQESGQVDHPGTQVIQGPRLEVLWPPLGHGHHLQTESWVGAGVGPSQQEWHDEAGASLLCGLGIEGHVSSLTAHCRELKFAAAPAHEGGRTGSAKQPAFSTMSLIPSWLREV